MGAENSKRSPLPPPSYEGTKVEVNNEHLPLVRLYAKVIEEWKEDGLGDVFQVECEVINDDSNVLPDFCVEVTPSDCVQSIWNLVQVKTGIYRLLGYWTEMGGLKAGETMRWGMLTTTCTPILAIKPYHDPESNSKADSTVAAEMTSSSVV